MTTSAKKVIPKPTVNEPQLERIPAELRARAQWVCWKYSWIVESRKGRWNKVPYNAETHKRASSTDSTTWRSFDCVVAAYRRGGYDGVGYVFTPDDPYCGVDFDHCFEDIEGEKTLKPDAAHWVENFDSYTEYSVSGEGLHIIIKATPSVGFNNNDVGRELYDRKRYFCFTGDSHHDEPMPIAERQDVAEAFIKEYDPKNKRKGQSSSEGKKGKKSPKPSPAKWQPSGKAPLLKLADITYNASKPLEKFKADLGVRISEDSTAQLNGGGRIDCRGYCHGGDGATGLFYDPQNNNVNCNKGCVLKTIAQAFEMTLPSAGYQPYCAAPDGLFRIKAVKDGVEDIALANFTATITGQIIRDDGTEQTDLYEIMATLEGVSKVGTVAASDFPSLKWVYKLLGAQARVYPNQERYVVDAVRALSKDIQRRTVVAHTGWRKDGDEWLYYHAGGAIGASGLIEAEVSLPSQLENFILVDPPGKEQLATDVAAMWSNLLDVTPNRPDIMVADVGEILCSAFSKPDFSGFAFGTTGTYKTGVQALKQSFYGNKYNAENLPESWQSSQYSLETFASKIKDAAACVDEFKPEGAGTTREKWHAKADYVLRGAANKQGRSTLRSDRSERPPRIPQGLVFCSGEELPNGESLRARLSIKEYDEKTVDLERLTIAQKQAADGVYVRVMSGFIQWLATDGRIEKIHGRRDAEIQTRRQKWITSLGANTHGRTPNNVAHLEWGWDTFLDFLVDRGVLDEEERASMMSFINSQLTTHARSQAQYLQTANDALRFVELIQSSLLSGKVHLTSLEGHEPEDSSKWGWRDAGMGHHNPQGICIGAIDKSEVYLIPEVAYKIALESGAGTDRLRATQGALQKRLKEERLLARTTEGRDSRNTVKVTIRRARVNALCFRASTFEGCEEVKNPDEWPTEINGEGGVYAT
jgi:hypothetical protein